MDSSIFKKASEYLGEKNKHRQWKVTVTALAAVVVIATAYILSKPAQTLVNDTYCGVEEHTHTEECYSRELICEYADLETLPSDTQDPAGQESVSQKPEGTTSQGTDTTSGTAHQHDENCYVEEKELTCGQEESAGHTHTDACKTITENRELTCDQEESAGHTHTDACKTITENRELTCGLTEGTQADGTEHSHGDGCYTVSRTEQITCGQEESAGHTHGDACYTVSQTEQITCGQEESTGHTHSDACYQVVQKLVCGQKEGTTVAEGQGASTDVSQTAGTTTPADGGNADSQAASSTGDQASASTEGTTGDTDTTGSAQAGTDTNGTTPAEGTTEGTDATGTAPAEDNAEGAAHVHTEECYGEVLVCKAEEHTHGDRCYQEVFCGIQGHTHGVSCYDEEGELTCEIPEHKHTDNCYKEPHCGLTVHIHGTDCYDEAGNLTCGLEEHTHVDECYISNTYYCTGQIHVHTNDCYDLEGNLRCGKADYWVHSHSETCYDKNERLICTLPEREETTEGEEGEGLHTHTEECYGVRGVLACGQIEVLRHDHDDTCRIEPSVSWTDTTSVVAYCGRPAHTHQDTCKDSEGNMICNLEEHIHTEECFEEPGYGCLSQIHIHEADCYDKDGNLQCGLADYVLHTHGPLCYGLDGKLLCTLPEIVPHVHGPECYTQEAAAPVEAEGSEEAAGTGENAEATEGGEPVEGQENTPVMVLTCTLPEVEVHEHTAACRNENGALVCGKLQVAEHVHTEDCIIDAADIEITQSFKGADFIVTATYNKKEANLPEEAVLFAERITAEGNEEYYAQRAAQYQEMQGEGDENTMQALLRIGFTAEGAEVEPEAPVTITVQFLDENGMAEGSPVTVVHFGEAGNERIEGTNAQKNSTTFQMNSFSEVALGWKVPAKTVTVDKTFTYEDDAFTVKFHVEGEATLPTEEEIQEAKAQAEGSVSGGDASVSDSDAQVAGSGEGQEAAAETGTEGEVTSEDLEAVVEPLGEDTEEYEAALAYAEETGAEDELLSLQVLSYGLTYENVKLDLTGCKVTMEVTPTEALIAFAEGGEANVMAIDDAEIEPGDVADLGGDVSLIGGNITQGEDGLVVDNVCTSLVSRATADVPLVYEMVAQGTDNTAAVMSSSQANPTFTVRYLATLDIVKKSKDGDDAKQPVVINTDTAEDGKMPVNGEDWKTENGKKKFHVWYLTTELKGDKSIIASESKTMEVYEKKSYEFIMAPGLVYVDRLAKNGNYKLVRIEITNKDGKKETYDCCKLNCSQKHTHTSACYLNCNDQHEHTDECYKDAKEWSFTNKQETVEGHSEKFILITEGAAIDLIYVLTSDTPSNNMKFYDYDISDGKVYDSTAMKNNNPAGSLIPRNGAVAHNSGDVWYMYTNKQGINSNFADQNFGFGNGEGLAKTGMGSLIWDGNTLNQTNGGTFSGCTFGLVTKLKKDGTLQYASGVKAPNLFNEGAATGKTEYDGSLTFRRMGDTYTLISSKVTENGKDSSASNLDEFQSRDNWNKTRTLWSNNFYPLDNVSSAGSDGHDLKFGAEDLEKLYTFTDANTKLPAPESDYYSTDPSKGNHNHYFGMWYTVEFDLTEDYIGPLEYIFYGDDDMWVFLDGEGENKKTDNNGNVVLDAEGNPVTEKSSVDGQLICDIGGVHGAVGEYVNLWNYIEKGTTGHYTLSFFYTERGASGSTCWMQFTLPSVSFITPKQTTGQLQVEKEVTGPETDGEFGFKIGFYEDKNMTTPLMHNFSYEKRRYLFDENGEVRKDEDGNPVTEFVSNDVLIWDGACFTLKADEYITISYLPDGAYYRIEEVGPVIAQKDGDRLKYKEDGTPDWEVLLDNPYTPDITGGTLNPTDKRVVTGVIKSGQGQMEKIHYNNLYQFELPETGGTGTATLYALAGVLSILFGAGLVYRKKFRERRA